MFIAKRVLSQRLGMAEEPRKVPVGSEAPDFALEGVAGIVRLADYRRQAAVLLVFMRAFG